MPSLHIDCNPSVSEEKITLKVTNPSQTETRFDEERAVVLCVSLTPRQLSIAF